MEESTHKNKEMNGGAAGAVVIFFIFLFVFAKWGPSIPFSVLSQSKGEPMTVSAEGKSTAIPDIAKINAGIQITNQSLKQAQSDANKKSQTLVDAIKSSRVTEKDIKTNSYNVFPQQDYGANPPRVTGYTVNIDYEITVRDMDKVNEILTKVTENGANLVGGISFDLSDEARAKAKDDARTVAVTKAKQNAQSLAKASGVMLGKIVNISESENSYPRPIYNMALDKAVGVGGAPSPEAQVEPGTTDINLTVTISYEVR